MENIQAVPILDIWQGLNTPLITVNKWNLSKYLLISYWFFYVQYNTSITFSLIIYYKFHSSAPSLQKLLSQHFILQSVHSGLLQILSQNSVVTQALLNTSTVPCLVCTFAHLDVPPRHCSSVQSLQSSQPFSLSHFQHLPAQSIRRQR